MKLPRGNAGTDLSLFIVFLVLLGIVWVASGGPDRPISRSGPFLESPLSENSTYALPSVDTDTDQEDFVTRISKGFSNLQSGEERSPYAEYVSLSVSTAKKEAPSDEYLTIKTARALSGTLTISDWHLESSVSDVSIPLGFGVALPHLGQVHAVAPIAVGANATVYVVSGHSPIGASLRLNSCTGYLSQFQTFEPRLPTECPLPVAELQDAAARASYTPTPTCYAAASTVRQCTILTGSLPGDIDPTCYAILTNDLTYNGCVGLHQNDVDFYKNEWRVYLGQDTELWGQKGERIRLVDEAGRVIDAVSY